MSKERGELSVSEFNQNVVALARAAAPEALETLIELMRKSTNEKTRLIAAMTLLDRACGRVPTMDASVYAAPNPPPQALPYAKRESLLSVQDKEAASEEKALVDAKMMRQARVKVLEAINQGKKDEVWTAPKLADVIRMPVNVVSAMLVKLQNDVFIQRAGPGMFKQLPNS